MKLKILIFIIVISLITISLFSSCSNSANEYVIVEGIELTHTKEYKYKVELNFWPAHQYFYTNNIYTIGDTLNFCKYIP